jgi:hypothetical protein
MALVGLQIDTSLCWISEILEQFKLQINEPFSTELIILMAWSIW